MNGYISELESSLENARDERDEATQFADFVWDRIMQQGKTTGQLKQLVADLTAKLERVREDVKAVALGLATHSQYPVNSDGAAMAQSVMRQFSNQLTTAIDAATGGETKE